MSLKNQIRAEARARRLQVSFEQVELWSIEIAKRLQPWVKNTSVWHSFIPIQKNKEVDTILIRRLLDPHQSLTWVTSQVIGHDTQTIIWPLNGSFDLDPFGIPTPLHPEIADESAIDVILIPLLAADIDGNRLGYGKGYYDKLLGRLAASTVKIGIDFFEPYPSSFPVEPHDIPLDLLVTPLQSHDFR